MAAQSDRFSSSITLYFPLPSSAFKACKSSLSQMITISSTAKKIVEEEGRSAVVRNRQTTSLAQPRARVHFGILCELLPEAMAYLLCLGAVGAVSFGEYNHLQCHRNISPGHFTSDSQLRLDTASCIHGVEFANRCRNMLTPNYLKTFLNTGKQKHIQAPLIGTGVVTNLVGLQLLLHKFCGYFHGFWRLCIGNEALEETQHQQ